MTRIKIKDLPKDNKISATELGRIFGGGMVTQAPFHQARVYQGKVFQAETFQGDLIPGCISKVWFSSD
jgi:hypothetical protein